MRAAAIDLARTVRAVAIHFKLYRLQDRAERLIDHALIDEVFEGRKP